MSTREDRVRRFADRARSALVADALDAVGLRAQCMAPGIGPVIAGSVVTGRVFLARCVAVGEQPDVPYVGLLQALDAIGPGELMVLATGGSDAAAVWGELVSSACRHRGAAGAVTDGLVRDVRAVRELGFPVFARGSVPYDVNGRFEVEATVGPLEVGGVDVRGGDLIVADDDGVAVVPPWAEAEVIERVVDKATGEDRFREAVLGGMRPSEAYERFGVL